jgi:hypothetical protein
MSLLIGAVAVDIAVDTSVDIGLAVVVEEDVELGVVAAGVLLLQAASKTSAAAPIVATRARDWDIDLPFGRLTGCGRSAARR